MSVRDSKDPSEIIGLAVAVAKREMRGGGGTGLSDDAKQALLQIASKVVYIDGDGEDYYNALYDAFYGNVPSISSIAAVFSPGNRIFYPGTSLNELKQYLAVTATYSDSTTAPVTNYSLSGNLTTGANTITVSYGGETTTFAVTITSMVPEGYTQVQYINSRDGYTDTGLTEAQVARAEYQVSVTNVYYTKGNHILSASNTFFPYLSGSNGGGDYSQIRCKLKGSESVASGSAMYAWSLNTIYTIEGFGENNEVLLNGDNMFSLTAGSSVSSSTYLIFATQAAPNDNGYRFHGKLYYMKLYDSNGDLLRNYIPCINSNNVAGLYDTVTNTFLSSLNQSSEFQAGPSV